MDRRWTGPREKDVDRFDRWTGDMPIPPERFPFGPPEHHQPGCTLLIVGGRFCDCDASDEGKS